MSKNNSKTLNTVQIESIYHSLFGQGYIFRHFIDERKTRIKIILEINEQTIGSLEAEKTTKGDVFTVTYSNCKRKGLGKILYYYAMNFIYPNFLTHEEHISESAQAVWSGIYECLNIQEGEPCRFQF